MILNIKWHKAIIACVLLVSLLGGMFITAPAARADLNRDVMLAQIQQLLTLIASLQQQLLQMDDDSTSPEGATVSKDFAIGDRIVTTDRVNFRYTPGGILINTGGKVTKGLQWDGTQKWYYVEYDNGDSGWSAGQWLKKSSAAVTEQTGTEVKASGAITSISESENPLVKGTATGVSTVGFSISAGGGDKAYGSGDIAVVNGTWSHKVSTNLLPGTYTLKFYLRLPNTDLRTEADTMTFKVSAETANYKVILNGETIKDINEVTEAEAEELCKQVYNNYETYHFVGGDVLKCYWNDEMFKMVDGWKG